MGNFLFTILGFALGWGCEKLFDNIFNRISLTYRIRKLRKKLKERVNSNSLTPNLTTIGEGLPYFDISTQPEQVSLTDEKFLLSFSSEDSLPINTDKDKWLSDCGPKEIAEALSNCGPKEIAEAFNVNNFLTILEECRKEVIDSFLHSKEGCYFNNKLYGVLYSDGFGRTPDERESPVLTLRFFETDYFTHRVMGKVTEKLREKDFLPSSNLELNQLNNTFRCFRTSLGISIIIIIPDTNEIILTRRSVYSAYSNGIAWIYVSVTETISETDYDCFMGMRILNIKRWIKRALFEEIGLKEKHYDENSIKVYDMFFENNFYQDGITASVKLRKGVNMSNVKELKAKDKQMEVKEIFAIENTTTSIKDYISKYSNEMREQTIYTLQSYATRLDCFQNEYVD
ncbi:MAG: hypothetical protein IKB57_02140 [Bacteroidaceae bacterium]|nr:hypothetical protein [Bacteroidaceae bacterium]